MSSTAVTAAAQWRMEVALVVKSTLALMAVCSQRYALAPGMDKQLIDEDVAQLVKRGGIGVTCYLPPHSRMERPVRSYVCSYPCAPQLYVMYIRTHALTYINKCVCLYAQWEDSCHYSVAPQTLPKTVSLRSIHMRCPIGLFISAAKVIRNYFIHNWTNERN